MKKQQTGFLINRAVIMMAIALIVGCSTQPTQQTHEFDASSLIPSYNDLAGVGTSIPDDRINSLPRKLAQDGILQLEQGNLVEANQFFNQALMFDPTDSYLQWLKLLCLSVGHIDCSRQNVRTASIGQSLQPCGE